MHAPGKARNGFERISQGAKLRNSLGRVVVPEESKMLKNHKFWIKVSAILMFLTGLLHATSLFVTPVAKLGVDFKTPPTAMGDVTVAVLHDTCGNLVQIVEQ